MLAYGGKFTGEQFDEGRLSDAVGSHNGDASGEIDTKVDVLEEGPHAGVGKGAIEETQHRRVERRGFGEVELPCGVGEKRKRWFELV